MPPFREFGIRRVLAGTEAVVPRLIAAGIDCYLLALPMGLDVNHTPLQAADPRKPWERSSARPMWQGKGASPTVPVVDVPPAAPADDDDASGDEGVKWTG